VYQRSAYRSITKACACIQTWVQFHVIDFRIMNQRGHAVDLLVEALYYKPESHGFNFRLSHWIFFLTYLILPWAAVTCRYNDCLGVDCWGIEVRVPVRSRIFTSPYRPDRLWCPVGTGGSFPGVKRQGREGDHSPPTNAEVKKTWIYTSTPPYAFIA
jgi:hypothetical protein